MASSTLSTRRRTSSCEPTPASLRQVGDGGQQSRHQRVEPRRGPAHPGGAACAAPRKSTSSCAALPGSRNPRAASAARELRRRHAAHPGLGDAIDARHFGAGRLVAREHDFLEGARHARAMQVELGGAGLPVARSPWPPRCARASARPPESCASARPPASAGDSPAAAGIDRPPRAPARRAPAAACRRRAAAAPPAATASACAGPGRRGSAGTPAR